MRLGDAHLQVFGQTSDDQFMGCIQLTPKYKTKRKGTVWSRERFVGQGGVLATSFNCSWNIVKRHQATKSSIITRPRCGLLVSP